MARIWGVSLQVQDLDNRFGPGSVRERSQNGAEEQGFEGVHAAGSGARAMSLEGFTVRHGTRSVAASDATACPLPAAGLKGADVGNLAMPLEPDRTFYRESVHSSDFVKRRCRVALNRENGEVASGAAFARLSVTGNESGTNRGAGLPQCPARGGSERRARCRSGWRGWLRLRPRAQDGGANGAQPKVSG
jgi:hypothetical protein